MGAALADIISVAVQSKDWLSFIKLAQMQHEAAWTDVAAKAKRLVQSGQVTVLRNAPQHIMAHVVGDHGEYNCEISRHDPESQIVEQWNCECPWAQYAFDRTRKWKKLEGRVCSHVLAAYWKAKATPLDHGEEPGIAPPVPVGQKPGEIPGQQKMPGMTPEPFDVGEQRQFSPDEEQPPEQPKTPELVTGPQPQMPFTPPTPQTVPMKPQYQQLQLFDITAPPGMQPIPGATPVSIPGGRPPTPGNPVQFPGTFSHFLPIITVYSSEFIYSKDTMTEYFESMRVLGKPIYVSTVKTVVLELSGGKIPLPGAQPYDVSSENVPLYKVMDLGYNPATGEREDANVNALQGAPEHTGQYADVAPGRRAEVLDYDEYTKMAYLFVPLNYPKGGDVRLHPHALKGWVDYADIRVVPNAKNPAR